MNPTQNKPEALPGQVPSTANILENTDVERNPSEAKVQFINVQEREEERARRSSSLSDVPNDARRASTRAVLAIATAVLPAEHELRRIERRDVEPLQNGEVCVVCLHKCEGCAEVTGPMSTALPVEKKTYPCGHTFHIECMMSYICLADECPYCEQVKIMEDNLVVNPLNATDPIGQAMEAWSNMIEECHYGFFSKEALCGKSRFGAYGENTLVYGIPALLASITLTGLCPLLILCATPFALAVGAENPAMSMGMLFCIPILAVGIGVAHVIWFLRFAWRLATFQTPAKAWYKETTGDLLLRLGETPKPWEPEADSIAGRRLSERRSMAEAEEQLAAEHRASQLAKANAEFANEA